MVSDIPYFEVKGRQERASQNQLVKLVDTQASVDLRSKFDEIDYIRFWELVSANMWRWMKNSLMIEYTKTDNKAEAQSTTV